MPLLRNSTLSLHHYACRYCSSHDGTRGEGRVLAHPAWKSVLDMSASVGTDDCSGIST